MDALGIHTDEEREATLNNILTRLAVYNEMPVTVATPFFPERLQEGLIDTLDQFMRGIITAEAAARQMHNRVSLWLIE